MTRKQLLVGAAGVALTSIAAACGVSEGDDGSGGSGGGGGGAENHGCVTDGPTVEIEFNHDHELTVSAADVAEGMARTYAIQGASGHSHDVTLSANDFTQLRNGVPIKTPSSNADDGHSHIISVVCA
ncbi:hypothetical protein JYT22_00905 [Endomicrobium sp. AH-315-J14]|nr:hypothetical protein [Endomicrobium sp. AH-315-J14]